MAFFCSFTMSMKVSKEIVARSMAFFCSFTRSILVSTVMTTRFLAFFCCSILQCNMTKLIH